MIAMIIMIMIMMAILRKEEITICPGQDVRQEEKLSQLRMRVNCLKRKIMIYISKMYFNQIVGTT